jgi:hypothetical protein
MKALFSMPLKLSDAGLSVRSALLDTRRSSIARPQVIGGIRSAFGNPQVVA